MYVMYVTHMPTFFKQCDVCPQILTPLPKRSEHRSRQQQVGHERVYSQPHTGLLPAVGEG